MPLGTSGPAPLSISSRLEAVDPGVRPAEACLDALSIAARREVDEIGSEKP
jgi:hypothetical protein